MSWESIYTWNEDNKHYKDFNEEIEKFVMHQYYQVRGRELSYYIGIGMTSDGYYYEITNTYLYLDSN